MDKSDISELHKGGSMESKKMWKVVGMVVGVVVLAVSQLAADSTPTPGVAHKGGPKRASKIHRVSTAGKYGSAKNPTACCKGLKEPYLSQCQQTLKQIWWGTMPSEVKPGAAARQCEGFKDSQEQANQYSPENINRTVRQYQQP